MIFPASATRSTRRASTDRGTRSRAVNALGAGPGAGARRLSARSTVREGALAIAPPIDLRRWLLPAALIGLMIDALVSALARGRRAVAPPKRGRRPCMSPLALGARFRAPFEPRGRRCADLRPRHGCGAFDPPRLCRDRRRGGRRNLEARADGADAGARFPHLRRACRAGRARSGARRTRLLSADLLADRRRAAAAAARSAHAHRRLHEERRHASSSTPATR